MNEEKMRDAAASQERIESKKRETELQERVKELEVLVRGYSNELDTAMGVQHDLEMELAKYKEAKPVAKLSVKQGRGPRKSTIVFVGDDSPSVGEYLLYAHPDNAKE